MNPYDKEIIRVLTLAGPRGLAVGKIARHVFNACNSLFDPLSFDSVHTYVVSFLVRGSHKANPVVERTGRRGVYRLNYKSPRTRQLLLEFKDDDLDSDAKEKPSEDLSLPLF